MADERGRPIVVGLVKATYRCAQTLSLAEEQVPWSASGTGWYERDDSSYRYEPETAFIKPATDVVLVGHAHSQAPGTSVLDVGLKAGPVQKIVRVFGDRYWIKANGRIVASKPRPFDKIPLSYELAFGGWDKADKDPAEWRCDQRNPVGRGFGDPLRFVEEGKVRMPNIEDPTDLVSRYGDAPAPAGFGFVSPHWQSRARYAGTYDERWAQERKPLLPNDFDRRFFSSASPGLTAPGYLSGNEEVTLVNASAIPQLKFRLPGVPPPTWQIKLRNEEVKFLETSLDTVVIDTDEMTVTLIWRNYICLTSGPHDVDNFLVRLPSAPRRVAL